MAETNRKILVPYDYTELSDYAVKQAVVIAKTIDADIYLLHIIDKITKEADDAKKLDAIADSFNKKYGVNIETKIRTGVIHKVIKAVAEAIDAFLVIMKTQPPRGGEKLSRSRSIRVMMGAKIPFIVVQAPPQRLGFRNIVFPIDFRRENKEKLFWVSALSKYYTSKIHFFKPKTKDYRIRANMDFARRFLEGKTIDYEIITGTKKLSSARETIEFANKIDAQLIIIVLRRDVAVLSNLLGLNEQQYIANKYKIPIMVINSKAELHKYEGFS